MSTDGPYFVLILIMNSFPFYSFIVNEMGFQEEEEVYLHGQFPYGTGQFLSFP